jgi:hypothetical protein
VVEEGRNRSHIIADRARGIIESLVVRSPISGLVLVKENRDATGGVFFSGMSLPEFRPGDTVASGRSILDVSDTADMEITARVNEQERTTLVVGQAATVRADALPGVALAARIAALSGVAIRSRQGGLPGSSRPPVPTRPDRDCGPHDGPLIAGHSQQRPHGPRQGVPQEGRPSSFIAR